MTRKTAIKVLKKKKKPGAIKRFTQVQHLGGNRLSARDYRILKRMTHSSKALYNVGLYTIKQTFRHHGRTATTKEIDAAMKADVNYTGAQSNSVQAIRRKLLGDVSSFFEALETWKQDPSGFTGRPKFPTYRPKEAKRILQIYQVPKVDSEGYWSLPMNSAFKKRFGTLKIRLPQNLRHHKVTYIEIVPRQNGRFFDVHYTYEVHVAQMKQAPTTTTHALGIDFGVDNLMSCASNRGEHFLIDGKPLKSLNRYWNKQLGKQQQTNLENGLSKRMVTRKQASMWRKREKQVNGYMSRAVGVLFKQVKALLIDTIVVGYNEGWKQKTKMGKKNNQSFVQIPFQKLLRAIQNKCVKEGIRFLQQEESYTSQASFLEGDAIPLLSKENRERYTFSGKRLYRGLYRCGDGRYLHADINAASNILRKANVVAFAPTGHLLSPVRLKVFTRKTVASRTV